MIGVSLLPQRLEQLTVLVLRGHEHGDDEHGLSGVWGRRLARNRQVVEHPSAVLGWPALELLPQPDHTQLRLPEGKQGLSDAGRVTHPGILTPWDATSAALVAV